MKRIVVLIGGNGSNLQALIDKSQNDYTIVAVISHNPNAYGVERAKRAGIPYHILNHKHFTAREDFDSALLTTIRKYACDIVVLAGFMRILTSRFIQQCHCPIINIHPSLLPHYKGLDTHARVLQDQQQWHGCSVHFVSAELDSGQIIAQCRVKVLDEDNAETLKSRVHKAEHLLYPMVLCWLASEQIQCNDDALWFNNKCVTAQGKLLTLSEMTGQLT